MRQAIDLALAILLIPGAALADAAAPADITSGAPCDANEAQRFRAHVLSDADAPESLWHLVTNVLCPIEGSAEAVEQHLPASVRYADETFDAGGRIMRSTRSVSAGEASSIITASTHTSYGELTVRNPRRARLQLNNIACALDVLAAMSNGGWVIRKFATQCE